MHVKATTLAQNGIWSSSRKMKSGCVWSLEATLDEMDPKVLL